MVKNKKEESIVLKPIREGYNLAEAYFEIEVKKAASKKEIKTVLNLEQLTGNRLKNFYVETDKVRDADTIASLEELLKDPLAPYTKRLFSGFTGSGKTTELIQLYVKMQKDFNVIIFSAWNRLSLNEITIKSLLFEILEDVLNYMSENNLVDESNELLGNIIKNIMEWCSETRIIKTEEKDKDRTIGTGIDFLKGLFFKAKTETRFAEIDAIESIRKEARKIKDLIFECNKIFDYLEEKTGKETLIIIDDLEKMQFMSARDFYIRDSAFIRDFHCKMVMTIPVELVFHPDFAILQGVFGEAEVLPMIKVKDEKGKPFNPGIDCLTEILGRRVELSLFENQCYMDAVKYSGGAIRELFRIVQRAALFEKSDNKITIPSMQKSIDYHKNIFASRVQEHGGDSMIKFEDYLEVLFDIYDGNKTAPKKTPALLDLLRTLAVMKFNGDEGFYDTHPLLDNFIKAYKDKEKKQKYGK
jgi:hypothetical protein